MEMEMEMEIEMEMDKGVFSDDKLTAQELSR